MPILIFIAVIILFVVLVKRKKLSKAQEREQARKRTLERDRREREKREILKIDEPKVRAEEVTLRIEAETKIEQEPLNIESKTTGKEECLAIEGECLNVEGETESEENEAEIAKKPLEEVIKGKIRKSRPLSMNEQPTFKKLRETLEPEYVVLSQVSFGAILWTWSKAVRNRYNRKIVDFVVCDKGFNVVAVIELDDSSHKGKEERDAERDLLLSEAGITVIRYKFTPESSQILEDIKSIKL